MNGHSLSLAQLDAVEKTTLHHYNHNAESFWHGTKDHDVSQNYDAMLSQFDDNASLDILDFGCGPGRDVSYFKSMGHNVIGLDGSEKFCDMARALTGCDILCQKFLELDLPIAKFDCVFANASLFHVPKQSLPKVLEKLHQSLKLNGVLFTSTPRGNGEGINNGRYGNFMELEELSAYLTAENFSVESHYYRPSGLPVDQQRWLAVVSRSV